MRASYFAFLFCIGINTAGAAEPATRYAVKPDLKTYPQASPAEALASVVKAIESKKLDYLLAQLADPKWVDARVKRYGGMLAPMVDEAKVQLNPLAIQRLQRFSKDGTWKINGDTATATLPKLKDRVVRMKKVDDRWFLINDYQPDE